MIIPVVPDPHLRKAVCTFECHVGIGKVEHDLGFRLGQTGEVDLVLGIGQSLRRHNQHRLQHRTPVISSPSSITLVALPAPTMAGILELARE